MHHAYQNRFRTDGFPDESIEIDETIAIYWEICDR